MNDNGTYRWVRDNDPTPKEPVNWKKIRTIVLSVVLAIVVAVAASTGMMPMAAFIANATAP